MNISDFLSKINKSGGLARNNRVSTRITPPLNILSRSNEIIRDLEAFCPHSTLPGLYFDNEEIRHFGLGKTEQRPTDTRVETIGLEFFVDNEGLVHSFFETWFKSIYDFTDLNDTNFGLFSYPDEYMGTMEIEILKEDGTTSKKYTLERIYPVTIESVSVGWDMTDTILLLPITFSFYSWKTS